MTNYDFVNRIRSGNDDGKIIDRELVGGPEWIRYEHWLFEDDSGKCGIVIHFLSEVATLYRYKDEPPEVKANSFGNFGLRLEIDGQVFGNMNASARITFGSGPDVSKIAECLSFFSKHEGVTYPDLPMIVGAYFGDFVC